MACAAALLLAGAAAGADGAANLDKARARIYSALVSGKVLNADRSITRMSHVCSLRVDGRLYPVIDLQEVVKRELTADGVNTIVVLSPELKPVQKIDYTTEQPLYCDGNKLYVFGNLTVDGAPGSGNQLTFRVRAQAVSIEPVEVTKMPMQSSGTRKSPPQ